MSNSNKLRKLIKDRQKYEAKHTTARFSSHKIKDRKTDINYCDVDGKSLFHYAIEEGNLAEVRNLIKLGANIDQATQVLVGPETPIAIALRHNQLEIAQYLFEQGADCSTLPLETARSGEARLWLREVCIAALRESFPISTGFNGVAKKQNQFFKTKGFDFLDRAAELGFIDYFKEKDLVKKPFVIDAVKKRTLLNLAAANGQLPFIEYVIETLQTSVEPEPYTKSALQIAIENNNYDSVANKVSVADFLIKKQDEKTDQSNWLINWLDDKKQNTLMTAINSGNLSAVEYVLKHNPDLTNKNIFGENILHLAIKTNNPKIAELLLKNLNDVKSIVNEKNIYGNTPWNDALQNNNPEIIKLLFPYVDSNFSLDIIPKAKPPISQLAVLSKIYYYMRSQYRDMEFFNGLGSCNGFDYLCLYYCSQDRKDYYFDTLRLISTWDGSEESLDRNLGDIPQAEYYTNLRELMEQWIQDIFWFEHATIIQDITNFKQGSRYEQSVITNELENQFKSKPQRQINNKNEMTEDENSDKKSAKKKKKKKELHRPTPQTKSELLPTIFWHNTKEELSFSPSQIDEIFDIVNRMPSGTNLEIANNIHVTATFTNKDNRLFYYDSSLEQELPEFINFKVLLNVFIDTKFIRNHDYPKNTNDFINSFTLFCFQKDLRNYENFEFFVGRGYPKSTEEAKIFRDSSPNKFSHLHIAVISRSTVSLVKLIQDDNCDLLARDRFKRTALSVAINNKNEEAALLLFQAHTAKKIPLYLPITALCVSAYENKIFRLLDDFFKVHENEIDYTALLNVAIRNNDNNNVELFILKVTDINHDYNAETPLYIALKANNVYALKILLNAGAKLTAATGSFACNSGLEYIICINTYYYSLCIPQYHQNINALDASGNAAIHYAMKGKNENIMKDLLLRNADLNLKNSNNKTIFDDLPAITSENYRVFYAVASSSNFNSSKKSHKELLYILLEYAIKEGNDLLFNNLILLNPPIELINKHNKSGLDLLHLAVNRERFDMLQTLILLRPKRPNLNTLTRGQLHQATCLHTIVQNNYDPKYAKLFLDNGADADIKNTEGKTARELAQEKPQFKNIFNPSKLSLKRAFGKL